MRVSYVMLVLEGEEVFWVPSPTDIVRSETCSSRIQGLPCRFHLAAERNP